MENKKFRRLAAELLTTILVSSTLVATPLSVHGATNADLATTQATNNSSPSANVSSKNKSAVTGSSTTNQTANSSQDQPITNSSSSTVDSTRSSKVIKDPSTIATMVQGKSATEIANMIKDNQLDPQSLLDYTYSKIKADNPKLNSVIYTDEEQANQQLANLTHSSDTAPFYGVPLLLKGLGQAYKGYPNTNGLTFEADNKYGYTKNFVQKLQKMGFIITGETNFPELGLINVTKSILNGDANNPWDTTRNPGGSSGGSAAAVADGLVPVATGNDAGGSLRIPASWSGVIGLKPTQGLILGDSTSPSVVNFVETKDIQDTQTLLQGLMNPSRAKNLLSVPSNLKQLKIAYTYQSPVGTPVSDDAKAAVTQAVNFLRSQGFTVVEQAAPVDGIKLMHTYFLGALDDGTVANYLANQFLHRNLTASDVDTVVSPMTYALYEASKKAPKTVSAQWKAELKLVNDQMTTFHQKYPIYLTPTTATVTPKNDDPAFLPNYVEQLKNIKTLDFNAQMQLIYDAWLHGLTKTPFTQLANLSGEPALSLPTYLNAQNLPLGIQFEGVKGSDQILLALGKYFEDHGQFKLLDQVKVEITNKAVQNTQSTNHQTTTSNTLTSVKNNKTKVSQSLASVVRLQQGSKVNYSTLVKQATPIKHRTSLLPRTGNQNSVVFILVGILELVSGFELLLIKQKN